MTHAYYVDQRAIQLVGGWLAAILLKLVAIYDGIKKGAIYVDTPICRIFLTSTLFENCR